MTTGFVFTDSDGVIRLRGSAVGGSPRPYINDTDTGVTVNQAGGFVSDWETFDLGEPGVGVSIWTITAADADGGTWDSTTGLTYQSAYGISNDGTTWATPTPIAIGIVPTYPADPVGDTYGAMVVTPRFIRTRAELIDANTGLPPASGSPSLVFTLNYTAS